MIFLFLCTLTLMQKEFLDHSFERTPEILL